MGWLVAMSSLTLWATEYHIVLKAPTCSTQEYRPAVVGAFGGWWDNVNMSKRADGTYEATVNAEQGSHYKFRSADCTGGDWSNEIYVLDQGRWVPTENLTFPRQREIQIDYSDGKWSQCSDSPVLPPQGDYSGTLPVLFINTEGGAPVVSKDNYLTATYYIDNMGLADYDSVANKELPDTLQIKGRGNWTWSGFEKKPYRLKLYNKTALLGMEKNKHWTLLAHADDYFGWLKNTLGLLYSRQLGLAWTPEQRPVEVVLNGDYIGLYMLTEQIRVDKKRVNITEQADEETDPELVTGGWLVEIDNYQEDIQVRLTEPANEWHREQDIWVTPKSPEVLSTGQMSYLTAQMHALNDAIYAQGDEALLQLLDINEAVRFYLVQELMSDGESYHGSCYLHKNRGNDQLWRFGPVWDFGNAMIRNNEHFIYQEPPFSQVWIAQLMQHEAFRKALSAAWKHWVYYDYAEVEAEVRAFADLISQAAKADGKRWPQYNHSDMSQNRDNMLRNVNWRVDWLTRQWGAGEPDMVSVICPTPQPAAHPTKHLVNGQLLIEHNAAMYDVMGNRR